MLYLWSRKKASDSNSEIRCINLKKLVIFDLDGTLVDSIQDLAYSANFALEAKGLPQNSLEEYYHFVGNGMEHLIRSAMKDKSEDEELYGEVRSIFDEYYDKHSNDRTVAYDGVSELLKKLSEKGIETAVLSNKAQRYIEPILKKAFENHKFAAAYGQREGIPRKPDGTAVKMLAEELGYTLEDSVYIGDSEVDVLTAENAGIDLICVLWGFRSKQELLKAGAKELAENSDELFDKIVSL